MSITAKVALLVVIVLAIATIINVIHTRRLIAIGTAIAQKTKAFEAHPSPATKRILVLGDSSAVGVGASPASLSIAGRLSSDYPLADVKNIAVNGSKVQDLPGQLNSLGQEQFDLIVIQIGGNDIVRLTSLNKLKAELPQALDLAKQHSENIVLLTSGNVGTSKLLPFGSRTYYSLRTRQVRKIFMAITADKEVKYVDLYRPKSEDPYAQEPRKYYSPDFFHPSEYGYGDWYAFVAPVVKTVPGFQR